MGAAIAIVGVVSLDFAGAEIRAVGAAALGPVVFDEECTLADSATLTTRRRDTSDTP